MCIHWLSGALVGVGGSDFIGSKILDFGGSDSSRTLIFRGGILMSRGDFLVVLVVLLVVLVVCLVVS